MEVTRAARPGLLRLLPASPRIAVLRASRLGDLLCTVPALRALRAALPDAEIDLVTLPILGELAERLSYIDRFVPFPGHPGIAEQLFEPAKTLRFFEQAQARRYDLAVQLQGSGAYSNPFILMMGARYY